MKKLTTLALATMTASSFAAVEHYGTMRASYISATNVVNGVDDVSPNGSVNATIPVFARESYTNLGTDYTDSALTQIAFNQSRYGIKTDGAVLEFDFNGNGNQGGAVDGQSIRIRQANMSFDISKNVSVTAGKGMSQMAGLDPHTFQISDPLFFLGNTGFVRDFIRVNWDINKSLKFGYETTSSGDNVGTQLSGPNHGLRLDWMSGNHHVGVAHKMGTAALKNADITLAGPTAITDDVDYTATKVFYAGSFNKLGVNVEYYMATNGGNMYGTLAALNDANLGGLATAGAGGNDVEETGYWVSLDYSYGNGHVHVGVANATIDDPATGTIGGNGDTWFGVDYEVASNTDVFLEYHSITTAYEGGSDASGTFVELGFMRNF
jgi:hypothetical protein